MAEVCINIPDELKIEIEESELDWPTLIKEFVTLKLFERQFSKSVALQRAVFESLIAKSKLSEKDAKELADKINIGMAEEFKSKFSKP